MGTQPVHHITNLQCVRPIFEYGSLDHNDIRHDRQQNSTAPEHLIQLALRLPKYISVKLLHDSSGLPYLKDRLLSCTTVEKISNNPLVEE